MEITFVDAAIDGGSACPHIVRIWKGSVLQFEYVAKANGSSRTVTFPNDTYDVEIVNPNLFESSVRQAMFWYNPNQNYATDPVGQAGDVLACSSRKVIVDGNVYTNLYVETQNFGTNSANILYAAVGQDAITTGLDKDGNALNAGDSYFQNIGFKKVADNTMSPLTISNKRNWETSLGLVDVSTYISYIPKTTGNNSGVLTAPSVSKTNPYNTESLIVGGMIEGDVVSLLVSGLTSELSPTGYLVTDTANANGQITMSGYGSLVGYTFKLRYKRGNNYSPYSQDVTVVQDLGQLPQLVLKEVQPNNSLTGSDYYVNEEIDITGFTSGAELVVKVDEGTSTLANPNPPIAVENVDYTKTAIENGYRIKFLRVNTSSQLLVLKFSQAKTGNSSSVYQAITVRPVRPLLPKPTISHAARKVGEGLTITNNSAYADYKVLKGSDLATTSDYTQNAGVITFLAIGTYNIIGTKQEYADSAMSDAVIVTPAIISTTFVLTMQNMCTVDVANIQVGTGDVAANVTNWIDGLEITIDLAAGTLPPNFFVRDKTNVSNISDAKAYVE